MIDNTFCFNIFHFASPSVVVELLSQWLFLNDFCVFDTSMSNRTLRSEFLHYLYTFKINSPLDRDNFNRTETSQRMMTWISTKQMRLKQVILKKCDSISESFVALCDRMSEIHIENCPNLTYSIFVALLKSSPGLTSVSISHCNALTDVSILELSAVECVPLPLDSLSITHCVNFSDRGLKAFVSRHCTQLRSFSVSHCRFTDSAVNAVLQTTYRTLETFRCERCPSACPIESVLQKMGELYAYSQSQSDDKTNDPIRKPISLKSFSLSHTSFSTLTIDSINVGGWLPLITRLETGLQGVVYLRLYEEGDVNGLGGVMRDSEFVVAVTHRQGEKRPEEERTRVVQVAENNKNRRKTHAEKMREERKLRLI